MKRVVKTRAFRIFNQNLCVVGLLTENCSRTLGIIFNDFGFVNFNKILKCKFANFLSADFSESY